MSLKKDVIGAEVQIGSNEAQKSLVDLAQKTSALTNENDRLRISQAKLKALGKDHKEEYDKVTKAIAENNKTVKENKAQMDALRKTIGLSDMSMKQMRTQATTLRRELSSMNQSADPVRWKKLNDELKATEKQMGKVQSSIGQTKGVMSALGGLLPVFSFAAIAAGAKALISNIINVRKEFEKYEAVLTNTLGSNREARKEMQMLQKFAAETPFALTELTGAFVKLTNYGLKPSKEELRRYGDLASSVGKGIDQFTEAMADAVTGEFERLKEFGIKAKKEGDKITFTFKEQTTVVDNNAQSIKGYISGLGDLQGVSGSMAAIAGTLGGKISNMGDAWDGLMNTMGGGSSGIMVTVIGWMTTFVQNLDMAFRSIESIKQSVKDQSIVDSMNSAIVEIDQMTKTLILGGMDQAKAHERAIELYNQSIDEGIRNTQASFRGQTEEQQAQSGKRLNLMIEERKAVRAHYAGLEDLKKVQEKNASQKLSAEAAADAKKEAEKAAKEKLEAYAKAQKALEEFIKKSAIEQQDAINKYFHDAGDDAWESFVDAFEKGQKGGIDFSIVPEMSEEKEKKDPALDYASKKMEESPDFLALQYKAGIIGKQEYEDKLTELTKKAEDERFKVKEKKFQDAQQLVNFGANFVSAMMDFELEKAGDNEEKKAAIRKKYANIQFLTTASQIVIDTSAAIMKALAELGPIAGPIAAGIIGATGVVQLAIANKERQKMMGSKKEGGFSRTGSDDEVDGFYHKNEFIASAPAVRNPTVKPFLDIINMAQESGTIGSLNLTAMLPAGRQAGGYASASGSSSNQVPAVFPAGGASIDSETVKELTITLKEFMKWKPAVVVEEYERKRDSWQKVTSGGLK